MSRQAVVVTTVEHPHKIVHVNAAWEKLCGYTQQEVLHQTLSVIQGRDTNIVLADATVRQVATTNNTADSTQPKENIVADTYIVNYKKDGSPFKNHICVSTMKLSEDQPDVEFLVGVLEEVDTVPLRLVVV